MAVEGEERGAEAALSCDVMCYGVSFQAQVAQMGLSWLVILLVAIWSFGLVLIFRIAGLFLEAFMLHVMGGVVRVVDFAFGTGQEGHGKMYLGHRTFPRR